MLSRRFILLAGIALFNLALAGFSAAGLAQAERGAAAPTASNLTSVLYRFDPSAQTFLTVPLPAGANPLGVAVTGTLPAQVWFTEPDRDRIGNVVFTPTLDYVLTETVLAAGSQPYLIALNGQDVWFTERAANQVGRLNALTGQVDEFSEHGLPANAGLADVAAAPDGSVWVAGQFSKRIYRLVITSTVDYAFHEYLTGTSADTAVGPYGLDVMPGFSPLSYQIAFASPSGNCIGIITPGTQQILIASSIPPGYQPTDIVYDKPRDSLWFSNPGGRAIGLSFKGTLGSAPTRLTPIALPMFLSRMDGNTLWISQQDSRGHLAKLVYLSTSNFTFTSYPLPLYGARPNGVALADDGAVWVGAAETRRVFLPVVLR
jgi:streptogramin lyase